MMTDQDRVDEIIRLIETSQDRGTIFAALKKNYCLDCFSDVNNGDRCWACYESPYYPEE